MNLGIDLHNFYHLGTLLYLCLTDSDMNYREIHILIKKEILLEWRQKYALNGILLYLISTIFICYLSFNLNHNQLNPPTWNALYWIIILFTSVNAVAKSFIQDEPGTFLYLYTIVSPLGVIISKIIYNAVLIVVMASIGYAFYTVILGNPVLDQGLFLINIGLASVAFSTTLTMVSSIASKARNSGTLMVILSFPIILPMLLIVIKISKNAMDGLDRWINYTPMLTLVAITVIVITIALFLFPFLWRN